MSVLLGKGDGTFRPAVNYAAGSVPSSVAVGDFNGDGKLDLAVTNIFDNDVSVLLGNGDGTFQPAVNYFVGLYPVSVAVGDFNGDGKPDLATADTNGNNVGVLLGNGDGTFQEAPAYGAGSQMYAIATGDFNGDGETDLVTANAGGNNVSVLLGNGDGTFQAAVDYATGASPLTVAVGDFNGDGKLDLATANSVDNNVSVLLGNGDGTFQAVVNYATGSGASSVAVGDFNGDGKPDLVVTNETSDNVSVLLGNGDGTFQVAGNYASGRFPYTVAVGDLNGDGKLDLAVGNDGSSNVSVLLGNGDGTFHPAVYYAAGSDPFHVALGDFNGDGKLDLAVTDLTLSTVSVLLGNGDGTFRPEVTYAAGSASGPGKLTVGDFNGDSKLDLAVVVAYGSAVNVLLGNGDGTFQAPVNYGVGTNPLSVAVGDFNGDGKPDLAVANFGSSNVSILLNTTAYSGPAIVDSPAPNSILPGSSATFQWTPSDPATAYWINVGSTVDGNQYYQSGSLSTSTRSAMVSGLPTNGGTVYATMYSLIGGQWVTNTYQYAAYNEAMHKGVITSPAASSILSGGSVTFQWSAGPGATAYWLDIGSAAGGNNIYSSGNLGSVLSEAVSGLPTSGSTVYATLYSLVSGQWVSNAYTYTASNLVAAAMITPTQGSTLSSGMATFGWIAGTGASAFWVDIGTAPGGNTLYSSGNLGFVVTTSVSGLPVNGSTIYVTLYSLIGSQWIGNPYTYTAFNLATAGGVLTTPTPRSTLTGSSVMFTWTAGSGASAYWMDIGTGAGGNSLYSSGNLGNVLTTTVNGLPTNGSTIYVTLYSLIGGQWTGKDYTYTASDAAGGLAVVQTPAPGTTLSGNSATFTWTAGSGASAYWLDIGTDPGGSSVYGSGNLGKALTTTVSSLPANGSTVYLTLYSLVGGQWLNNSHTYVSGP